MLNYLVLSAKVISHYDLKSKTKSKEDTEENEEGDDKEKSAKVHEYSSLVPP